MLNPYLVMYAKISNFSNAPINQWIIRIMVIATVQGVLMQNNPQCRAALGVVYPGSDKFRTRADK
jgi:hypothetical protein